MFTEGLVGEMLTDTGAVTVIVADALLVVFETEVAVSVTFAGFGTVLGARYVMATPDALDVDDNVPQALPLQPVPVRVHFTPRFLESPRTVAVNCCVPMFACTFALVGETLTVICVCALLSGAPWKAKSPRTIIAMGRENGIGIRLGDSNMSFPLGKILQGTIQDLLGK